MALKLIVEWGVSTASEFDGKKIIPCRSTVTRLNDLSAVVGLPFKVHQLIDIFQLHHTLRFVRQRRLTLDFI